MGRCEIHCPGGGAGVATAVALAAGVVGAVAVASAVSASAAVIAAVVLVADLVLVAVLVAVLRGGPRTWRPARPEPQKAYVAVEARTAPLAIEASAPVLEGIVIRDEIRERR